MSLCQCFISVFDVFVFFFITVLCWWLLFLCCVCVLMFYCVRVLCHCHHVWMFICVLCLVSLNCSQSLVVSRVTVVLCSLFTLSVFMFNFASCVMAVLCLSCCFLSLMHVIVIAVACWRLYPLTVYCLESVHIFTVFFCVIIITSQVFSLCNCVLYHSCLVVMFLFLFIFYLSWLSSRFDIYNVLCYCYCYYLYCFYVFVLIFIFCCSVHVFIVFVSAFVVLVLCLCSYNNFFTCLVSVSAPAFTALVSCVIAFLCSCADVYGVFFRVSCQFRRL